MKLPSIWPTLQLHSFAVSLSLKKKTFPSSVQHLLLGTFDLKCCLSFFFLSVSSLALYNSHMQTTEFHVSQYKASHCCSAESVEAAASLVARCAAALPSNMAATLSSLFKSLSDTQTGGGYVGDRGGRVLVKPLHVLLTYPDRGNYSNWEPGLAFSIRDTCRRNKESLIKRGSELTVCVFQ